MDMIQAIGAPFPVDFSSCSNKLPELFRWTNQDRPIKVYIDRGIALGLQEPKKQGEKKIAWVCESRAIFHLSYPREVWMSQLQELSEKFDLVIVSEKKICNYDNFKFSLAGSNLPWLPILNKIPEKTKNTSLIASPKNLTFGHMIRHIIAQNKKNQLDIFGGAGGSSRFGFSSTTPWPDKSEAIVPYRFSLAIENDSYETYYTEKITDCFASGTIPVYWGSPDIGEHFNPDGIITLTPEMDYSILTEELYQSKIEAVKDNMERVSKLANSDDMLYKVIMENL
jgi:hypothetical protein